MKYLLLAALLTGCANRYELRFIENTFEDECVFYFYNYKHQDKIRVDSCNAYIYQDKKYKLK